MAKKQKSTTKAGTQRVRLSVVVVKIRKKTKVTSSKTEIHGMDLHVSELQLNH